MPAGVRYCTTEDGVRIAYTVEGEGPALVVLPIAFSAFSLVREVPSYEHLLQRLGEGRSLVRFDSRGVGLSQRDINDASRGALALDVLAVMDALGLERASLIGAGPIGATALLFSAIYPHRVAAVIAFGSIATVPNKDWYRSMVPLMRSSWETAARSLAGGNLRHPLDDAGKIVSIFLRSTTGEVAARYMEQNIDFDMRADLGKITARAFVIHSQDDPMYPFSGGEGIAAGIPGARLMPIEGNYSIVSLGDKNDAVADAINSFLDEEEETRAIRTARRDAAAGLRTVLFTDLVAHTEMMSRLGDDAGRTVLREHERITREVLKQNGGTEVKTMGDGFMASFGSVTKAVECAIALQKAMEVANSDDKSPLARGAGEGKGVRVRVGLNAGEPIEEDGDLFGATVILASRIAAKAGAGEILVADTVRGLCSGKGFLFSDRGEFVAKGFEEPVRIYEVSWRE